MPQFILIKLNILLLMKVSPQNRYESIVLIIVENHHRFTHFSSHICYVNLINLLEDFSTNYYNAQEKIKEI